MCWSLKSSSFKFRMTLYFCDIRTQVPPSHITRNFRHPRRFDEQWDPSETRNHSRWRHLGRWTLSLIYTCIPSYLINSDNILCKLQDNLIWFSSIRKVLSCSRLLTSVCALQFFIYMHLWYGWVRQFTWFVTYFCSWWAPEHDRNGCHRLPRPTWFDLSHKRVLIVYHNLHRSPEFERKI